VTFASPIGFLKTIAPNIYPGRFSNTKVDLPAQTTYSATIPPPWTPLAMRSGRAHCLFGRLGTEVRDILDPGLVVMAVGDTSAVAIWVASFRESAE
jgi:hypothetical protein